MTYTNSYVAFLDVLGFKQLVLSKNEKDKRKIEEYLFSVNNSIRELSQNELTKNVNAIVISDSIILSIEQSNNIQKNVEILKQLCVLVSLLQFTLAIKDIWLRGAISSGETYFDKKTNQIIGKGYIHAYELESTLAISPRVILDNKIIKELSFNNSSELISAMKQDQLRLLYTWPTEVTYGSVDASLFYLEKDVPLFIDYLDYLFHVQNDEDQETIYKNIRGNMHDHTDVYKKFKWVANYYISKLYQENGDNPLLEKLKQL